MLCIAGCDLVGNGLVGGCGVSATTTSQIVSDATKSGGASVGLIEKIMASLREGEE